MVAHSLNDLKLEFIVVVCDRENDAAYVYKRIHWSKLRIQDIESTIGCIHSYTSTVTISHIRTASYDKLRLIPSLVETTTAMHSNRMRDTGQLDILRRAGSIGFAEGEIFDPEPESIN